jgi:hypothetical protein
MAHTLYAQGEQQLHDHMSPAPAPAHGSDSYMCAYTIARLCACVPYTERAVASGWPSCLEQTAAG